MSHPLARAADQGKQPESHRSATVYGCDHLLSLAIGRHLPCTRKSAIDEISRLYSVDRVFRRGTLSVLDADVSAPSSFGARIPES